LPADDSTAPIGGHPFSTGPAPTSKGVSPSQEAWRRLKKSRTAMGSLWFLVAIFCLSALSPLLPLQPPRLVDTKRQYEPPRLLPVLVQTFPADGSDRSERMLAEGFGELDRFSATLLRIRMSLFGRWQLGSLCGTDKLGRDVLSRLFWGSRISLAVGLIATLVSLVIGVSYGAIAGYNGGRIDNAMMRLVDILYSIPFIFVVIFILTILGEESIKERLESVGISRIVIFFFIVGAIYWLTMARVVRGQVISLKNEPFVEAARAIGASQSRIIFLHLVPNLLSVVIVYLTMTIPRVMLFEAFLSFLGLGVEPPDVSWGLLANEGVKVITPVRIYWWLVLFPGLALGFTLLALNFLGDGLRDALDPKMKDQ
jgi:oligopeptide transport system permease protein